MLGAPGARALCWWSAERLGGTGAWLGGGAPLSWAVPRCSAYRSAVFSVAFSAAFLFTVPSGGC